MKVEVYIRMKRLNWIGKNVPICIVLVLLVAFTGCGGASNVNNGKAADGGTKQPAENNSVKGGAEQAAAKPEQKDVKVGLPLQASTFLPIYLADSKGYFKDEGLNVSVYEFKGDAGVVQALAGKSVDINVASLTGLVNSIKSNQPFIAFWGGFNHADFDWYSPKLKTITKGTKFGVSTYGSLTDFLTRYAVRKAGLDPEKDVKILQVGGSANALAAMESGQIDASTLATPFKFMADDKGMHLLLSEKKDLSPTWPQHVIYAQKDFVKKNPETIRAFLRAVVKGMDYIEKNPEDAAKVLTARLKLEAKYSSRAVKEVLPGFDKKGKTDQKGLDFFWEITVESGDVDKAWPDDKWLDKSFINSADKWLK